MSITKIITIMSILLTACVPLPDGGQDTETVGWDSSSSSGAGEELPEGLWEACVEEHECPRGLHCVAGAELELGSDGEWVIGQSGAFCTAGCSEEIPCPEGPEGQIASCLTFPSQPGTGWCYIGCGDQACPMGQTCMDLGYSLQQQGDHHYCV